jgi:hypothetical protein
VLLELGLAGRVLVETDVHRILSFCWNTGPCSWLRRKPKRMPAVPRANTNIPIIMGAECLLQPSPRCRDDRAEMFLDRLGAAASIEG